MKTKHTLIALTAALALHTTTALAVVIITNTVLAPGDTICNSQDIVANH